MQIAGRRRRKAETNIGRVGWSLHLARLLAFLEDGSHCFFFAEISAWRGPELVPIHRFLFWQLQLTRRDKLAFFFGYSSRSKRGNPSNRHAAAQNDNLLAKADKAKVRVEVLSEGSDVHLLHSYILMCSANLK